MSDRVAELEARLEATQVELETQAHNFAMDKARDLREIARLKREIGQGAGITDDEKLLRRLFDLWLSLRVSSGRKAAMTEDRIKALRWLVKHYQADGAEKAIRASAKYRFLVFARWQATGKPEDRRDDLTDFANNGKRTEALIALYDGTEEPVVVKRDEPAEREHPRGQRFDPVHELSNAMERVGCKMRGNPYHHNKWVGQCPAHDDRDPSLSIELRTGKVLLYCHAGCSTKSVLEALGLEWCDLFSPDFRAAEIDKHSPPPPEGRKLFDRLDYAEPWT